MTKNNFESEGATMTVSKIGQRRQVTIPKDLFTEMGLKEGDFIEVMPFNEGIFIKPKKLVDSKRLEGQAALPPAPSYEERMRLMKLLEGNREDDSEDIPIDEIIASRVSKETHITFDE